MAAGLAQEDAFDFAGAIAHPELGALLLVQIVDHDFMLDLVEHEGALVRGGGVTRAAGAG